MWGVIFDGLSHQLPDTDSEETAEWVDSFDSVVDAQGKTRARFLLMKLLERARELQVGFPAAVSTPYINTIPPEHEPWFPGDEYIERRIRAFIRWNAAVMVTRANTRSEGIGGHLATFASAASLLEVGFNHFFRGKDDGGAGDQIFFQGHAAPGIYAPRVPGRPLHGGRPRSLPVRGRPRRLVELSAPAPHAGLLGVPDGVDGPRPHQRHLPGALQPVPAQPPHRRHERVARVVLPRRRRDRRARVARGALPRGPRGPRQPDLRRQLQPPAPRRPRPRQREDHPGARGRLPRRGLERHQGHLGHARGTTCWRATSTASCSTR